MNACLFLAFTGATHTAPLLLLATVGRCWPQLLRLQAVETFDCPKTVQRSMPSGLPSVGLPCSWTCAGGYRRGDHAQLALQKITSRCMCVQVMSGSHFRLKSGHECTWTFVTCTFFYHFSTQLNTLAATLTFASADLAYPLTCSNPFGGLEFFFELSMNPKALKPKTSKL